LENDVELVVESLCSFFTALQVCDITIAAGAVVDDAVQMLVAIGC
jgi:hypothetical protein